MPPSAPLPEQSAVSDLGTDTAAEAATGNGTNGANGAHSGSHADADVLTGPSFGLTGSGLDSDPGTQSRHIAPSAAARPRADHGAAARMFDTATSRRRSVVFEDDDELDVPDFLK
jgi:hypothetical protein